MILYHASSRDSPVGESLKTPTGRADGDITRGGAVYLVDDISLCERYGDVYEIEVKDAISYKNALASIGRKKKPRYTSGVFVCIPTDTKILRKI